MATKSLLQILRDSEGYLAKHGVESARFEAEWLLATALELPRLNLYMQFDRPLGEKELAPLRGLLKRRASGEPLQYIMGSAQFMSVEIAVGPGVLVPRPETERLVELALARYDGTAAALDLCTGSGCIPLAIAAERPEARLTGVELSPEALAWAQKNSAALGMDGRVSWLRGDLFAPVAGRRFGLITANPPYVREAEMRGLPRDVRDHEPPQALVAGADGLDLIRRIVAQAPAHLEPGAWLLIEFGIDHADAVADLMRRAGLTEVAIASDYSQRPRIALGRQPH